MRDIDHLICLYEFRCRTLVVRSTWLFIGSMKNIDCPIYLIVRCWTLVVRSTWLFIGSMQNIDCPIYLNVRCGTLVVRSTWLFRFDAGHWLSDLLDYHLVWCGSLIIRFSCFTSIPIWFFPDCLSLIEVWERVSNEFDKKNEWKTIHTWLGTLSYRTVGKVCERPIFPDIRFS